MSGFPEQPPTDYITEQHFVDILRRIFRLRGFSGIQTRAIEPLSELTKKGKASREVYLLSRPQTDPADIESETDPRKQLGLHFDLTVPFARYVMDNARLLIFPLKRYQTQKVWHRERPQEGRSRKLIQADIGIAGDGTLPLHRDVEVPFIIHRALSALSVSTVTIHVPDRKVTQDLYQSVGVDTNRLIEVLRVVDKLDKIDPEKMTTELTQSVSTIAQQVAQALRFTTITGTDGQDVSDQVLRALASTGPIELLIEGLAELAVLPEATGRRRPGAVIADLKTAHGLDYYIDTVYESFIASHKDLGSVCSGGHYDPLATNGKRTFPGVGIPIGLSRLPARVIGEGPAQVGRAVPTTVLVAAIDETHHYASDVVTDALRARGISADMAPSTVKPGKQIKATDKRSIPFVWLPGSEGASDLVKDIRSDGQVETDAAT